MSVDRRNAVLIARREYLDRVRTRSFVVASAILAVIAIGIALAPLGMRYLDQGTVVRIGIVSSEAAVATQTVDTLGSILDATPRGSDPATTPKHYRFDRQADLETGLGELDRGALNALLIAERRADGGLAFTLRTPGSSTSALSQILQFGAFGVGVLDWSSRVDQTTGPKFVLPSYRVISTADAGGAPVDQVAMASRTVLATVLIVLIFVTLTIYGMWVATSVAAEKSSRVMELLISAATARQLLVGKVFGVGGAGLTQYVAIVIPASIVIALQDSLASAILGPAGAGAGAPLVGLSLPILAAYGTFFLLGFILYALVYAAAGSFVSRQEDVQQLALPLSFLSMVSYVAAIAALGSIDSGWVVVLSFVPFSSPFVMLARIMLGRVAPWEIALSIGILVASSVVVLSIATRIYANGVILYGQRPSFRDFLRAARAVPR
jgi:ABC-2 type transport system permease protein